MREAGEELDEGGEARGVAEGGGDGEGILYGINVVDRVGIAVTVVAVHIVELNVVVHVAADKVDCLVDLDRFGKLTVGLQVAGLRDRARRLNINKV